MKKIILFTLLYFLFVSQSSAYNNTFIEPEISMLPASENFGTSSGTDSISNDSQTMNQFCIAFGGTYVSNTSYGAVSISEYSSSAWNTSSNTQAVYDIVCDLPPLSAPSSLSGSLLFLNYNSTSGDYEISEDFIIGLIVRLVLTIMLFTLMWKFTRYFWNLGASLSPYIRIGKK